MNKRLLLGFVLLLLVQPSQAQHNISGYIVTLETAQPIANATVYLKDKNNLALDESESLRATTDSTGFYEISDIKEGIYTLNSYTTYQSVNEQYAMIVISDHVDIDGDLFVDFVFSEHAFKYKLHSKFRRKRLRERLKDSTYSPREATQAFFGPQERTSDTVARIATAPQIYVNSHREPPLSWYIENVTNRQK